MIKLVSTRRGVHSPQFYSKKIKRKKVLRIIFLILFFILVGLVIFGLRHERIQIKSVTVLGEDVVGKFEAVQIVEQILNEKYFWIIPKSNTFFYPKDTIEQMLLRKFPRYKSVGLNVEDLNALNITVEERLPQSLYCSGAYDYKNATECYFLDENGFIFAYAPSFSGVVYFVYTSEEKIEEPLGKNFIDANIYHSLTKFIKSLTDSGIYPVALESGGDEYRLVLPSNGKIIWRKDADILAIASNLDAFLTNEEIKAQKDFLEKILYLDLRVENKVFYKFKDE